MKNIINQINISDFLPTISISTSFFLSTLSILIVAKILLLFIIGMQRHKAANSISLLFFSIPMVTYIFGELAWIMFLSDKSLVMKIIWRIAWHMQPLQFYTQVLFLRSIIAQKYELQKSEKLIFYFFILFVFLPLATLIIPDKYYGLPIDLLLETFFFVGKVKRTIFKFFGFLFLTINMIMILKKVTNSKTIPHFLRLHLKFFFILLPISQIPEIMLACGNLTQSLHFLDDNMLLSLISSILFAIPPIFFARRIYNLRFLNLIDRVVGPTSRLTDAQLLEIKQSLCKSETLFEFPFIHIRFFDELLHIDATRVLFFLRHEHDNATTSKTTVARTFEHFIHSKPQLTEQFLIEDSILVYDELAFTHFYNQSDETADILLFMEELNAAIIIPLRQKNRFFGALIITKDEKKKELFGRDVQTQMQLYGAFVTYAVARLEQTSYNALVAKHNALLIELHHANQKNARFYEAITPLLKQDSKNNNGILLYKNGTFTILNTNAETFLQIDPNKHQGHPLAKALKELTRRVLQYNNSQTIVEKNGTGHDVYCQGFPAKNDEIIILLSFATIANTFSLEQTLLNPADIDYLIFLQGTPSGTAVDRLIPGNGAMLQKAKIHLLKTLLSKKTIFLNVQEDDAAMILPVAKNVCNKSAIHTIDATIDKDYDSITTLLFGRRYFIDGTTPVTEHGLLYTFDESGIIHIANAHLLSIKTQKLLLDFLKTGSFCLYKSAQQYTSGVTIILSSSEDLEVLASEEKFCKDLYDHLKDSFVTLPNLVTLPSSEFELLVHAFAKQQVISSEYHHLFELTKNDWEHLNANRPTGYHTLQKMMEGLINKKIQKSQVFVGSDSTLETRDEIILQAARLGKQTLKDRKLMRALWDKLQNQSKIAQILNVDRSSVYRRLKAYGIVL